MSQSLVDRYCAAPHVTALTAACCEPRTGAQVTADESGTVAIVRPHEPFPNQVFTMGAPVRGAVAISDDAALVAVGDDNGTVAVYDTMDGSCLFENIKEGHAGTARAMRALAFNPGANLLATLAVDGIIRIFDLQTWGRYGNHQRFGGETLQFDEEGRRLLALDPDRQPKLLDIETHEIQSFDPIPGGGGAVAARFTLDHKHVIVLTETDIAVFGAVDLAVRYRISARGTTGLLSLALSPDGQSLAAVTHRSVHTFSVPELTPLGSERHTAADPTTAVIWDERGVAVGGADGSLHRPGTEGGMDPVLCCTGNGDQRVAVHGDQVALWTGDARRLVFRAPWRFVEVRVDPGARLMAGLASDGTGVHVFGASTGTLLFDAGADTHETPLLEVGGAVVACLLPAGGLRWYELQRNSALELGWVTTFALSSNGSWLAVAAPNGDVSIIDPATGEDALPKVTRLQNTPVRLLAFVQRRAELLVLDENGLLEIYELPIHQGQERKGQEYRGRVLAQLDRLPDRMWGVHQGGRHAAVRIPDVGTQSCNVLFVDLDSGEVASEVAGLLPYVWVDADRGELVQPARGAAILEVDRWGNEQRVLRSLPGGEWITFDLRGVRAASPAALG